MSEAPPTDTTPQDKQVGNLTDFVKGATKDNPLDVEIAVDAQGRVVVFHDKEFMRPIDWYEYDITTYNLNFILDDGQIRNIGMALAPEISKHMQNSHQILTVHINDETGEADEGRYIPVIIHQS